MTERTLLRALAAAARCLETGSRPFGAMERLPDSENLAHSEFQSTVDLGMSCSGGVGSVESEESGGSDESEEEGFDERIGNLVTEREWTGLIRGWVWREQQN